MINHSHNELPTTMKTQHLIEIAFAACLVNCLSVGVSYSGEGGFSDEAPIFEAGEGEMILRDSAYFDDLRGAHYGRDEELMRLARDLIFEAGSRKSDQYDTPYTGRVKVCIWKGRDGKTKFTSMREIQWKDGVRSWQGPKPASNFYGAKHRTEHVISDTSEATLTMLRNGGVKL